MWIIRPAHKNNSALKYAWDRRWKYASRGLCAPKTIIITPSWLKVDKAIIFFMSVSNRAAMPAMVIVITPRKNKNLEYPEKTSILLNRIRRYTPAVTSVDEWTNADTGVGAAIAAGNQAEKGIWALFVQAAKMIIQKKISDIKL